MSEPVKLAGFAKPVEVIEIKMGWADCLIPLLTVYADGSAKGRADALIELRRMAAIADQHVSDNPPEAPHGWQCLTYDDDMSRWGFVAHGARYSQQEAAGLVERYEARGVKVRLLPC